MKMNETSVSSRMRRKRHQVWRLQLENVAKITMPKRGENFLSNRLQTWYQYYHSTGQCQCEWPMYIAWAQVLIVCCPVAKTIGLSVTDYTSVPLEFLCLVCQKRGSDLTLGTISHQTWSQILPGTVIKSLGNQEFHALVKPNLFRNQDKTFWTLMNQWWKNWVVHQDWRQTLCWCVCVLRSEPITKCWCTWLDTNGNDTC